MMLTDALAALEATAATAAPLVATAAYSAGRLDEFMLLMGQLQQNSAKTKYCIGQDNGDNKASNNPLQGCNVPIETTEKAKNTKLGELKGRTFGHAEDIKTNQNGKCYLTGNLATYHTDLAGPIQVLGGLIKITTTGGIENSGKFTVCGIASSFLKTIASQYDAAEALMTEVTPKMPTSDAELLTLLKQYKTNNKLKEAAGKINNWESSKPDNEKIDHLKTIFGINEAATESEFVTALKATKRPVKTGKSTSAETAILQMNDEQLREETEAALSELKLTANKSTNCPTKQLAAKAEAQKDCTKNTKKMDCKDIDGCKWTIDKEETENHCKAKEGDGHTSTATGTGEGATGTTTENAKGNWKMPAPRLLNANGKETSANIPVFLSIRK
uniref:Variant surface glycoprotein 1491 n=1 Tax=Trypanosoma brucei TaxID=5691 RepID=M4SWI7_9TRYP|nr:variant surface glycoprotein 1491 [Trypanosoma brucei]